MKLSKFLSRVLCGSCLISIGSLALAAGGLTDEVCVLPSPPHAIPDGATSSEARMIEAMQELKVYDRNVNAYLSCLDSAASQGRLAADDHTRQHNDAVERLMRLVAAFNEQVRTFRDRERSRHAAGPQRGLAVRVRRPDG